MVGWGPAPQASAGGVTVDGKAPPEEAPAEEFMAKLTWLVVAPIAAQLVAQVVVIAR